MNHCDVLIIGGGPAGATLASLLKKYQPELRVRIIEREHFPREHVGESQLPPISRILDEMGCWEAVEQAGFPIKIGATYRWGSSPQLWDFEFLPLGDFRDEPRPARYAGQRLQTAFQVDRAVYDHILLQHAGSLGCVIDEGVSVRSLVAEGDSIDHVILDTGESVQARYYVDASGGAAILRRQLGIAIDVPTSLKNIAFWDYWDNAEWAVHIGVGGTRVQVMSIGSGWLWFIPLSETRASVGYVCPVEHFKASGLTPEAKYEEAIAAEPLIRELTSGATREGQVRRTRDWSYLAERVVGSNWYLVGESAGFADPILAAGMTLAQTGARELAYILLSRLRNEHSGEWLNDWYGSTQRKRIRQHIRFADFWYSANGQFTDLQDYTAQIAADAGLSLTSREAFQWLGTGGFTNDVLGQAGIGGLDLAGVKQVAQRFTQDQLPWEVSRYNRFSLNLRGAEKQQVPVMREGRIVPQPCYVRGEHTLPVSGMFALWLKLLPGVQDIESITRELKRFLGRQQGIASPELAMHHALQALEVMLVEGWVDGDLDGQGPRINLETPDEGEIIHANRDAR